MGKNLNACMVSLSNLSFTYAHDRPIFRDFNWEVGKGESWAVLGPSGCGKTTLLYLLAGLRFPSSGQVLVDGQPLSRPRPQTGLILQDYGLLPWATVQQNAELGNKIRSFYGPDGKHAPVKFQGSANSEAWLNRLGLADVRQKYPGQISGGQRQRTAIARTLTLDPDLLLMDEPFSSLDAPTREGLQDLIRELWTENNLTMVTVTHSIEEAAVLGQQILILTQPPTRQAVVLANPSAAQPGYRETAEYFDLTRELRARLGEG